jgi:hypothetical protein
LNIPGREKRKWFSGASTQDFVVAERSKPAGPFLFHPINTQHLPQVSILFPS